MIKSKVVMGLVSSLVLVGATGCVSFAETPGERFQKSLKEMAELCQSKKLIATDSRCILPKLKPADPLATEEGRFAHSIKIPNPVPEDSGYKPGMTPEQYFDHLCKTEAGEFIYKTVENVEGLYLMRRREQANDYHLQHLYALEDPYSYSDIESEAPQQVFINPPWRDYKYFEASVSDEDGAKSAGARYRRYSGYVQDKSPMRGESVVSLKSRYGYTWRGITRSHDRELGIAGGELILMDMQSNTVLAVRRGFIRSGDVRNLTGIWWIGGYTCPKSKDKHISTYEFMSKVLKPNSSSANEGGPNATK